MIKSKVMTYSTHKNATGAWTVNYSIPKTEFKSNGYTYADVTTIVVNEEICEDQISIWQILDVVLKPIEF